MSYLGRSAKLSLKAQEKVSFLATAGQTAKTGLSYVPNFIEVYVNGILLTDTTDFTATNGNSVTFTVALALNDEVTVVSLKTFTVADHYTISAANTLLAAKATNTALATTNTAVALKAPIASPSFTGNVGIGQAPETSNKSGDIHGVWGSIGGWANNLFFNNNAYYNSGDKYKNTAAASAYVSTVGKHVFKVAPSGTADAAISWTTGLKILEYGNNTGSNTVGFELHGNTDRWWLSNYSANTTATTHMQFRNPNGAVGSIATSASSTSYNTSSDYRLKTDVQPMTGATATFKLLKPVNFEWIADGTRVDGFLAHELGEVIPAAATGSKDAMVDEEYEASPAVLDDEGVQTTPAVMATRSVPDMQGIDQSKVVPLLVATVQELIARIEALEAV